MTTSTGRAPPGEGSGTGGAGVVPVRVLVRVLVRGDRGGQPARPLRAGQHGSAGRSTAEAGRREDHGPA